MHTMPNVQNMQNSLLLTELTSALWAVYGYLYLLCPFVKKYNIHVLLLRHSKTISQCVDLVGTFLVPSFYDRDLFPA